MATQTVDYTTERAEMVADIEQAVKRTRDYLKKSQLSEKVIQAIGRVPRHEFVPESERARAYWDCALSIGYQQTISQPYIVALMTDLLVPERHHKVLEIGTGSGYQAAVLSPLVKEIYTIEIVPELAMQAKRVLVNLGYENIIVKSGNGYQGWPEFSPFDGIVVTAGGEVSPALMEQLKPGGRMVIPVGGQHQTQYLTVFEKQQDGTISQTEVLPVRFVPLIKD